MSADGRLRRLFYSLRARGAGADITRCDLWSRIYREVYGLAIPRSE